MSGGFTGNPLPSQPTHEGYQITQNFSMVPLFDGFVDMETWITFHPLCLWDAFGCHLFKYRNESQSCKRFWNGKELYRNNGNQKKKHPYDAVLDRVLQHHGRTVKHQCSLQWNRFSLTVNWQLGRGRKVYPYGPNSGKATLSTTSDRKAIDSCKKKGAKLIILWPIFWTSQ